MNPDAFLRLESVSKRYYIRQRRLGGRLARASMISWLSEKREPIWALRDVGFELAPGQMLGVIGANGSGKSTLLKLIARVSGPTEGTIESQGSLTAMLELGAGFHPDLTGYQNVYLQGNLMGLRKAEIDRRLDAIVDFADMRPYMDWPVKRYSTGMYARLGFSVALHVEARIILIDEILAVGDIEFQRRGLARLREIRERGETIIVLVTHDIPFAREYCDRMIWLDEGKVREDGEPQAVSNAYILQATPDLRSGHKFTTDTEAVEHAQAAMAPDSPLTIRSVEFRDDRGRVLGEISDREPITLAVRLEADRPVQGADLTAILVQERELPMPLVEIQSSELDGPIDFPAGPSELTVRLDPQILLDGDFSATILIAESPSRERYLAVAYRQGGLRIRSSETLAMLTAAPNRWRVSRHPFRWVNVPDEEP
jgi:ABC-type polysaccharide/polyol phosphate transport system ATPase subunit